MIFFLKPTMAPAFDTPIAASPLTAAATAGRTSLVLACHPPKPAARSLPPPLPPDKSRRRASPAEAERPSPARRCAGHRSSAGDGGSRVHCRRHARPDKSCGRASPADAERPFTAAATAGPASLSDARRPQMPNACQPHDKAIAH